jgi:hypothetical protein
MKEWKRTVAIFLVTTAGAGFAGRPLVIDNADPVGKGRFELELGAGYESDSACDHIEVPFGLSYGLTRDLQVGFSFGGQLEERNDAIGRDRECGLGDLELSAKWQFYEETKWGPAQALAVAVKIPTADDSSGMGSGETDYDISWIASKTVREKTGVHVNAGYTWVGEPSGEKVGDIVHCGLAMDYQLTDAVQWVGEVFAEKELLGGTQILVQCNTGFRWNPAENLTLDVAVGTGLHGDDVPDHTATAGLTWAFDLK